MKKFVNRFLQNNKHFLYYLFLIQFQQNRGPGAVLRTIPSNVLTLEQLNAVK